MNLISWPQTKALAFRLALLPLLLLPSNCSSPIYHQEDLAHEILRPRPGHENKLTNEACGQYKGDSCVAWSIKEYDLTDPAVREELDNFDFVCNLSGIRYKVCHDTPGFCRMTSCSWWDATFKGCKSVIEKFVPLQPYQYLLDAGLKCFNERVYGWTEVK